MSKEQKELHKFAEALLDIDRLKIVGELAKGTLDLNQLADQSNLDVETALAHLEKLSATGVVSLDQTNDGETTYAIDEQALAAMSKRQFQRARKLQAQEQDQRNIGSEFSNEEAKYIRSFTSNQGIIRHLPLMSKRKKLLAVLKYALQSIKPGQIYTEKQINQALSQFTRDPASVRRYLVDFGFIEREVDGSAYWLKGARDD